MDQIEMEGATVEEAMESALRQMGRREDEVEVEVLEKGSKGIFGLGSKPATVRVKLKEGGLLPPEAIARATDFLVRVIKAMGMDVEVEAKHHGNELSLEVDQGAGGILIGRRGTTLAALSYLMELIVSRKEDARVKVFVDVAGYLERRRRSLVTMAMELAEEAKSTGREVACEPMSAFERKVIHSTLHDAKGVHTFSQGEGDGRRVIIAPGEATESGGGEGRRRDDRPPHQDRSGERGRPRGRGGFRRGGRSDSRDNSPDESGLPPPLSLDDGDGDNRGRGGSGGRRRGRRGGRGRHGGEGDQSGLSHQENGGGSEGQ